MQQFYLIVNWVVAAAILSLGAATFLKSKKTTLNKVFALFTVSVAVWIISAYVSNDISNSPKFSVIGNYLVFLFSYISGFLLLWFAIILAEDKVTLSKLRRYVPALILIALTTCTPLVVSGVHRQGNVYAVQFGPLAILYLVGLVFQLGWALRVLSKNIKHAKGHKKANLLVLYHSMAVALPILLLTEFILPALTGWFGLTNIGILAMAIPVVALYYGVIKLKLFNLRVVAVRSLAYILAVGTIGFLYSVISYYITSFVRNFGNVLLREELNIVLIAIAISVYPPVISTFKKLSNQLFYRDAYDSQDLFDKLNRALVSTLNLNTMLSEASRIINETLKTDFCIFILNETVYSPKRVVGYGTKCNLNKQEITELGRLSDNNLKTIIQTDSVEDISDKAMSMLEDRNIAITINLTPNTQQGVQNLGYLIISNKKSGSAYTTNDIRVVDTIANELIIALQNAIHFEEIQNFNHTLQRQVEEATSQLRRTNAKLVALDETKDDFISMASHQLRTPLTSVKGYLSMVLDGDAGGVTPLQRKMLGQAFTSSQRMVYLISDLLNVSRLKTGKFVIERSEVDLAKLIDQEIGQLKEVAASHSLKLTFNRPKHFPLLKLDETKTRQVVMNFIDNAIHYTPAGGHVQIVLEDTDAAVELRVVDNGIGVPKAEQHHLFTKFYRALNARRERPDGTGLGLFMAKKVIIAEGGAVLFESQEGKGSMFGFMLPKSRLLVTPKFPNLLKPLSKLDN